MTDVQLTRQVALGGALFSLVPGFDQDRATSVIQAAADAGVRVFDVARAYAPLGDPTHNEVLFSRALAGRDDVLIGTKGGHFRTGPREFDVDNSPERLRKDVDDSLAALGVDRLGLFYVHRADGRERFRGGTGEPPPVGEAVAALDELRRDGKIAAIGLSNVTVAQLDEAVEIAPIGAVQNHLGVRGWRRPRGAPPVRAAGHPLLRLRAAAGPGHRRGRRSSASPPRRRSPGSAGCRCSGCSSGACSAAPPCCPSSSAPDGRRRRSTARPP